MLLPCVNAQIDWDLVCKEEANGSFWVNSFAEGAQCYGRLSVFRNGSEISVGFDEKSEFKANIIFPQEETCSPYLDLTCSTTHASSLLFAPVARWSTIHSSRHLSSIDLTSVPYDARTPKGLAVSSGGMDGKLRVWNPLDGSIIRDLKGHVGGVLTSRFFPSGKILLSGGSDTTLKIWLVTPDTEPGAANEDNECVTTLKGHAGGVLQTQIIDRGRNLVSSSRDGTIRLWDCGTQSSIAQFVMAGYQESLVDRLANLAVNDIVVTDTHPLSLGSHAPLLDERESGTEGKLVLAACENSKIYGFDLRARALVFGTSLVDKSAAANCITPLGNGLHFLSGYHDGTIALWDMRQTTVPVRSVSRSGSSVLRLLPASSSSFWAASMDGNTSLIDVEGSSVRIELVGPDCEGVYGVASSASLHSENQAETIFTAGEDGLIRKYVISRAVLEESSTLQRTSMQCEVESRPVQQSVTA